MKALAIFCLVFGLGHVARAATPFDGLVESCRANWREYSNQLNAYQQVVEADIQKASPAEIEKRIDAREPVVIFAMMSWPEMLRDKYDFWSAGSECAEDHRAFRRAMDTGAASRLKQELLRDYKACLSEKLSRKPLAPFIQILKCYDLQALKN